ncbi:amidase domain-containing protein [Hazenella sp. IB182357]|uniref:Amidase domain-containing protein n=1 Tax=Polycladospora coralii TaxID=2771432 RepID=A0A926NGS4_9BACL|nr:amidase domain-containing protein [Polycladospora coralii]MBD1373053.1 amidase domain-containing protein [Polycladospora coralii]MBS7529602.1 amidase domain-containing protein [Polycladospora coralii]
MSIQQATYDRTKAVQYANKYWNSANPAFRQFDDDCTNYVSQCIHAGDLPMVYSSSKSKGWWYRRRGGLADTWSFSWAVAHSLFNYLKAGGPTGNTIEVSSPQQLRAGDVICYDWEGDGRWNHNAIVTGFDYYGNPLVNAHTYNSQYRDWRYLNSPAWTEKTKYAFFHIR